MTTTIHQNITLPPKRVRILTPSDVLYARRFLNQAYIENGAGFFKSEQGAEDFFDSLVEQDYLGDETIFMWADAQRKYEGFPVPEEPTPKGPVYR